MHLNAVNSAINQMMSFGAGGGGSAPFSPAVLWPLGASSPGMWIDPAYVAASFQDSAGTTALSAIGTVADSANPVGLILDRKAGATVLADPGLHMLQATSTARPLASARRNLLTATEDFAAASWEKYRMTVGDNAAVAPDGTTTADAYIPTAYASPTLVLPAAIVVAVGTKTTASFYAKKGASSWVYLDCYDTAFPFAYFNIDTGVVGSKAAGVTATITPAANGFFRCTLSVVAAGTTVYFRMNATLSDQGIREPSYAGTLDVASHYMWHPQLELGSVATDYQSVTSASDYDASVTPVYQQYDGTDDGMATAAFSAGTVLTAGMDALIAIRRDSTANAVCGLYESVAEANKVFGIAQSGSGSGCVGSGAGTPTVWVDGTQLTGGTAVTRGTLHTALTAGDWHILEFRNLDLSTWTAAGFGLYTSYVLNGARGPIQLFATGQDANRDLARAEMAAYFGVTLP